MLNLLDRAAVLFSFEQLGGAEACMDMAKEYAMGRYAFGRSIASFQAIKHKLADMFIAVELARSNCYYGAWALVLMLLNYLLLQRLAELVPARHS